MKYLVLLVDYPEGVTWGGLSEAEKAEWMERHHAFGRACEEREGVRIESAEALDDSQTSTVRTGPDGALVVTEGPFAEAAEGIGGYYLMEVPHFDVLTELLAVLPPYVMDVRPTMDV